MTPVVSVILPTFNRADRLKEALGSVFGQTYRDFEVIVIDDGSTDDTIRTVRTFGDRIRCIRQENRGPAAARNAGVAVARGKYIAFLDDDDIWYPRKLELQAPILDGDPNIALVCGAGYAVHGEKRTPLAWVLPSFAPSPSQVVQWFLAGNFIGMCSVLVRAATLRSNGVFEGRHSPCEDTDMWLRLASRGYRFAYLSEPTWEYRYHDTNFTSNSLRSREGLISMWRNFLSSYSPPAPVRTQCSRQLVRELVELGNDYYIGLQPGKAWRAWCRAIALDRSLLRPRLLLLIMKSLCGARVLSWARRIKRNLILEGS